MKPYKNTGDILLLDKLVDYINKYLKFRVQGGRKEEFTHCQETLNHIFSRMNGKRSGRQSNGAEKPNEE